jgi:CDGSH-type Zn-finger protein
LGDERETRLALCRCGASAHKPFCDNSHRKIAFSAPGTVETSCEDDAATGGPLAINLSEKGPVLLNGNFEIVGAQDGSRYCGNRGALCRCGHSENKPFCDGTHKRIGFEAA